MKKPAVVKAPRQKSLTIRMRPDQIKTILDSSNALLFQAMAEGSETIAISKLRELANPAYKEIAIELGRFIMREVKPGKLHSLQIDTFPYLGYFHIYFTHDDGSHDLGQSWKISVTRPSGRTLFQHRVDKLGLGGAVKEAKKL